MCLQIWFCHMRHSSEMTLRITTNYYSSYVPLWLSLIHLFIYGTQLGLPMRRCKKRRHFNNSCAMLLCWHLSHHYHASCLFECCCWMLSSFLFFSNGTYWKMWKNRSFEHLKIWTIAFYRKILTPHWRYVETGALGSTMASTVVTVSASLLDNEY